jgi:hypothetical protein
MFLKKKLMLMALSTITLMSCSHMHDKIQEGKRSVSSLSGQPCGQAGSIDERIKDCSHQDSSTKGSFVLVTRTKDLNEVYKDTKSYLIWSYMLPSEMRYTEARNACKADLVEMGGVSSLAWRLPSLKEYKEAYKNGIRFILTDMELSFWTSTVIPYDKLGNFDFAKEFNVYYGLERTSHPDLKNSVRCVANY